MDGMCNYIDALIDRLDGVLDDTQSIYDAEETALDGLSKQQTSERDTAVAVLAAIDDAITDICNAINHLTIARGGKQDEE